MFGRPGSTNASAQARPFKITTGDISMPYDIIAIVFAVGVAETPSVGGMRPQDAMQQATNGLIAEAQKIGADAVVWVRYTPVNSSGLADFVVNASGTAVKTKRPNV